MRIIVIGVLAFGFLTGFSALPIQDVPEKPSHALQQFQRSRERLRTGQIQYRLSQPHLYERTGSDLGTINYVAQIAGPDTATWNLGDDDGLIGRNPERGNRAHVFLKTPERTYSHDSDDLIVMASEGAKRHEGEHEFRSLGAGASPPIGDLDTMLWRGPGREPAVPRVRESDEGGLRKVTLEWVDGQTTWWLDPSRDWNPTRVVFERDGKVVVESRSTLRKYPGGWFPERVEYFRSIYRDGQEPAETFEVVGAAFNQPEDPDRLEPHHIGVEPGFVISWYPSSGRELEMWDGTKPIPMTEFGRRQMAGELSRGPANARAMEALPKYSPSENDRSIQSSASQPESASSQPAGEDELPLLIRQRLTAWQQYTEDFIAKYKLNAEQSARARQMCREAEGLLDEYLQRNQNSIRTAIALAGETNHANASREAEGSPITRARAVLGLLEKRMDLIFDRSLRPRLELLPTRAQRADVESKSSDR